MNSKEALKELEIATNWSSDEDINKDLYNLWGNIACRTIKKDLDRLEEHRKIEEELRIDLITLFKALIGIWVKSTNGDVYYVGSPYLCFSENEKRELELQFRVGDTWYKIKDYGNTYALTKEELESSKNGN